MTLEELKQLAQVNSALSSVNGELEHDDLLRSIGLEPGKCYQELEMTSRYADVRQDVSYTNADISIHSHTFFEVICCHGGKDVEMLVGSERYRLLPGDIIFIPPGVSHRPILPEPMQEPYRRDVLWVSQDFIDSIICLFPAQTMKQLSQSHLVRTTGSHWEYLPGFVTRILKESSGNSLGWEAAIAGNVIMFLVHFLRVISEKNASVLIAEKPELLDRILSYIESNLHNRITLSETAQHFFVSESTVSQTFRNKLGISFYRCVTQRRLIAAKNLIYQDLSLEAIAEQVGFFDYSSFYRAFKQEYGISPRQYRNTQI